MKIEYPSMYDEDLRSISSTGIELQQKSIPDWNSMRFELVKVLAPVVYKEHPSCCGVEFAEEVVAKADTIIKQLQRMNNKMK